MRMLHETLRQVGMWDEIITSFINVIHIMIITHPSFDIFLFELKLWFAQELYTIATFQLPFLSVISFTMECISAGLHVAQSAPHRVEEFAGTALSVLQAPVVAAGCRAGQEK